jgi:transcriptional regulator with XRE-family HTH domain
MSDPPRSARDRLAQNARDARRRASLTQEAAAEQLGCSVQQVRRVERGVVNTTVDFIEQLAEVYGVEIAALFADFDTRNVEKRRVGRPPRDTPSVTTEPVRDLGRARPRKRPAAAG